MPVESENWFFKWLGAAAATTMIGVAAGAVLGALLGFGLGVWLWISVTTDGISSGNDDTQNLVLFLLTAVFVICGIFFGLLGGGVVGIAAGSLYALVTGSSKPTTAAPFRRPDQKPGPR